MRKIVYFIVLIFLGSLHASDVTGTWIKACSYDPIPGEKKPNYSTITATLEQRHIDIEVNYFTDSACLSPWKLMPTFLQTGSYSVSSRSIDKRIKGKKLSLTPVDIRITHYDNQARFKTPSNFTVYFDPYLKAYIQRGNNTQVFHKAIVEPKARVAKEVYKQENNTQVCVITMKMPLFSASFCLENVSFPKEKFRAYCEASKPEKYGELYYAPTCPSALMSSSCLYGLQELGHDLRRWYTKEELRSNPHAQKACETQLRGLWSVH